MDIHDIVQYVVFKKKRMKKKKKTLIPFKLHRLY